MNFVIDYEVAAVCLLIVLFVVHQTKRHLNIRINKIFFQVMIALFFVNVADICTVLVDRMQLPSLSWLNSLLNVILFLFQAVMYYMFFLFVLTLTEYTGKIRQWIDKALGVFTIIYLLVVITTPVTKAIFYIDNDGIYRYGFLHSLIYVMPCMVLIIGACILIGRHKRMKSMQFISSCLFTVLILGSTVIQAVFIPHVLIAYFFATLGLLIVHFSFQSPEYYLDHITDAFNEAGMFEILRECDLIERPVSIVAILLRNLELAYGSGERMEREQFTTMYVRYLEKYSAGNLAVYRLNDVFCLMYKTEKEAVRAAESIQADFEEHRILLTGEIPLLGNTLLIHKPDNFKNFDDFLSIIRHFRQEMSKNPMKSITTCDDEFMQKKKRYEDVVTLLKTAIQSEDISVCYQPIYAAGTDRFHSAEALVRLNDMTTIGAVYPDEFIPIAENENLIFALGDIIMKKICQFVTTHELWNKGIQYVEINLSAKQCMQLDLCEDIKMLLDTYKIKPSFLNFELTETAIIESKKQVIINMEQLISLGCTFALDDFGSGYANVNYLLDFPFDIIKLDKDMLWSYFKKGNDKSKIILNNIIGTLKELDLKIVAEGIETKAMKDKLLELGADDFQGYYFSMPLSEAEFLTFLER